MLSLDEVQAMTVRLWRAERGRYGGGRRDAPKASDGRGRRRAFAYYGPHVIAMPRWARTGWTVCHEVAHLLNGSRQEGHGSRFVAILIGLLARHEGWDAKSLLASAREWGLQVDERSIGALPASEPVEPESERMAESLLSLAPCTDVEAAIELGLHWRQVRGLSLLLIRQGRARWFRRRLVLQGARATA
jgi:hypothetical protein